LRGRACLRGNYNLSGVSLVYLPIFFNATGSISSDSCQGPHCRVRPRQHRVASQFQDTTQNLPRAVLAARQHVCPDVSVFDQTDRTPGWYREFICPSPGTCQTIHQAQLGAPVQDTREVSGRRCFLPFALIRRPPTSDILIAVCRFAFAHVTAVAHRRPGSWRLVE
jgi:hypothetical protein